MKILTTPWALAICLLSLTIGCAQTEKKTLVSSGKFEQYSAEEFFKTTTMFGSALNFKGDAVLGTNDRSGVYNVYRYPFDGSPPEQLTFSDNDAIYGVSWFPADDRFLYTSDKGGNELDHLFVQQLDGSQLDLTPGEKLKAQFAGWKNDNQSFFVLTNERDPKFFDVYEYQISDFSRKMIFRNDISNQGVRLMSPDGRWIVLVQTSSNANNDLFVVDLHSKNSTTKLITKHQGNVVYTPYSFIPNTDKLVFGSNEGSEFTQAYWLDLDSGESDLVKKVDWDVSFVYYSKQGRYRVIGLNEDAQTTMELFDTKLNKKLTLPKTPKGEIRSVRFSNDESRIAFYINSDTAPSNLYVHQLSEATTRQLTSNLNPTINQDNLVASEVVRFKSFDGVIIPNLLFKPKTASAKNKVPALIWIHGGPGGQSRKGYSAMRQHLVNHGYALLAINNRGSSGYGKTFYHLDDQKHGEDDLQDVVYGKKYLQSLDWVDGEKIGVIGGSYGGYLTVAAMTYTEEFEVGIDIFGVTNWLRTLESIPPYWESFKKYLYDEMGDPSKDRERLIRISPLFHADRIKKPMLVVQGANDPRVLKVESDEMVAAIRKNQVPVEYLLFEDEGHGFAKKANRIKASDTYVNFLNKYLKK